ncbi:MAG: permease [Bacillota bacterium]|nr:permease [Bacillota bacterium]
MEKMKNKSIAERLAKTSYKNFNVSVYCPVQNINNITDFDDFDRKFKLLYGNVKIGRAYLECYRGLKWCSKEQLLKVKEFFESKGIATSGGITTCGDGSGAGFVSLCYSRPEGQEILKKAVALNAEVFDEFIFDDFYFLNCRCKECVAKKGSRTWSQFRLDQKKWITEEIVMKTAKEINPDINVIVKFPQWYEVFNETGYDLKMEPALFDSIYTGTETRNPAYAQQHLPKYLSYFVMRYLESAAPGRNLGGWFDPYECTYNLTSYLEQGYLTLFAKAKEVTLFCLGSLIDDPAYQTFPAAVGQLFEEVDSYLDQLGNPKGAAAYRPEYARGEDNIHNYLGMCGVPFEPYIDYPEKEKVIFLAEGAAEDKRIVEKMQRSMLEGADVIVTSGFVRKLGDAFKEFVNVSYSSRKAIVSEYADSKDNGVTVTGKYTGVKPILIPQLDYCTNDVWELAAAYGMDNNFPIVLRCSYGEGSISVITIPDDMGNLYNYPKQVLNVIRGLFSREMPVSVDGPAQVELFVYDNDKVIVRSDMPYTESVDLKVEGGIRAVKDIVKDVEIPVNDGRVTLQMSPCLNYVLELQR